MPSWFFSDRLWDKGNNPKTAVEKYLEINTRFVADEKIDAKLSVSVAPWGYLKCLED